MVVRLLRTFSPLFRQFRYYEQTCCTANPKHLICFKQWTSQMVMDMICSAIHLKKQISDTHCTTIKVLNGCKIMILQELNEPMLIMAVSKAATLLGATDISITDKLVWENDYNGRVFSLMSDAIFVSTATHMCVQRFAEQATVPVMCMRSRTHATIQSLATIMSIIEEFGAISDITIAYLGPAHQVLNSYLLLCPMLQANIKFKCACKVTPVSPLLLHASEKMCEKSHTVAKESKNLEELLTKADVIISGPTTTKPDKIQEFVITPSKIISTACKDWRYYHTLPRGTEVEDGLFYHCNARTFSALNNMHYIAAALMADAVKGHKF